MRKAAGNEEKLAGINTQYNVNWMRTEHLHAVRTSRAAKNWQDIVRDKDIYPYLEYMPSTAGEPRAEHKKLYGIVKPVDDPFWDTWMPPADWGCRCSVKQVKNPDAESLAKQPPDDVPLPPPVMRNNPGKDGVIFTDKHPMISKVGKKKHEINSTIEILTRVAVRNETREYLLQNIVNRHQLKTKDLSNINLSVGGMDKILSQSGDHYNLKNIVVRNIDSLLPKMELDRTEPPTKDGRQRNIAATLVYKSEFKQYLFEAIIWKMRGRDSGYVLHSFNIKNKP